MQDRKLALNTVIVMLAFAADKLLAMVRELVVTNKFGTGDEFDAFNAAIQGPELLFTLISGGALVAAFIPVLSEYITGRDKEQNWRLASAILNIVVVVLLTIGLLMALFSEPISTRWLVPDYPLEKQLLTAKLLRIVLIQTFVFGISGVVVGILHAHQHFFLPAVAPIFYNLGQIFGVLVLVPRMGISGLTWGMVIGALFYLLIQTPALVKLGARYFPTLGLRMHGVRQIGKLMLPRIVSLGLVELADVFFVPLASRLPSGHLSAYFTAWRLMQFPETLFGTAIAQVFFPTLSELANQQDWENFRQKINAALRIILTLTLPSAAALIMLGEPLLTLIGGAFGAESVSLVQAALIIFSVRLVGEAMLEIGARLFYAQQNTVTPMLTAALGQSVSITLAFLLIDPLGYRGLAIATTLGFWIQSLLLLGLAQRQVGGLINRALVICASRALLGTGLLAGVVYLMLQLYPPGGGRAQTLLAAGLAGGAGLAAYGLLLLVTKSPELRAIPGLVSPRFKRADG